MVKAGDQIRCGYVYWIYLAPVICSEIQKTRPALVFSPSDMNAVLPRVIVAPITSKGQALGCRLGVEFNDKFARILLDQIRCIDKVRLLGKLGEIDKALWHGVLLL